MGAITLYRQQAGQSSLQSTEGASPFIHTNLTPNQIHLTVISNTLSVAVNDRVVTQAAIDYTPGFVGLWCGVYQPGSTLCAFDNLQAIGTPSDRTADRLSVLQLPPRRRMAINLWKCAGAGAPRRPAYLDQFKAGTTLTVTVDGAPLENPQQYWTPPKAAPGEAEMFWSYPLPALESGRARGRVCGVVRQEADRWPG